MGLSCFFGETAIEYAIIKDEEYHHAFIVKRHKVGDTIEINDLSGGYYIGVIESISKNSAKVKILEKINKKKSSVKITLYQCIPNQLSIVNEIIDNASQIDVTTFVPVISHYCELTLSEIEKKIEKWQKIAIQSIKQCKRLFPMIIRKPIKLSKINSSDDLKVVFYEKENHNTLISLSNLNPKSISLVIGTEGGFLVSEIDYLVLRGFKTLTLCENILKTQTAATAAISQINLLFKRT